MYSLIVPVYRNEESIPELLDEQALNASLNYGLEVVFVVDGSPDRSYAILRRELPATGFRSRLLLLSRNFGSFAAIRAGLAAANGPFFAVMAADLQEPPDLARDFFHTLESESVDVVIGTRTGRDDPIGFTGLFVSIVLGAVIVLSPLTDRIPVPGYSATVLIIIFFGALNTFGLGIVGAYTWRAFENTKRRPGYIVLSSETVNPREAK